MNRNRSSFIGTALALLAANCLLAQNTDVWNDGMPGFYDEGSSWVDGSPAGANDHILFDLADPFYRVLWRDVTGNTFSRSITVRNGGPALNQNGSPPTWTHTVFDDVIVESGTLEINRHLLTVQENVEISDALSVENETVLRVLGSFLASPESGDSSNVVVTGTGTELVVERAAVIGQFGPANMMVNNNGQVEIGGNLRVGFEGFTTVLFEDPGTTLEVTGTAPGFAGQTIVGGDQLGVLDFFAGASGMTQELIVTDNGLVDVFGSGSNLSTNATAISGTNGEARVFVLSGGQLNSGDEETVLGEFPGSSGFVKVEDSGSIWLIGSTLDVGRFGTGEIEVANGGSVIAAVGITEIGDEVGGSGLVTVSGTDAMLMTQNLDVGSEGDGELKILDGGALDSTDGFVGLGAAGSVEVSGDNSVWTTGTIRLDDTLVVADGGRIENVTLDIRFFGDALVTGAGSLLQIAGNVDIDNGTLTIDDGAVANVGGLVFNEGTLALDGTGSQLTVEGQFDNDQRMELLGDSAVVNIDGRLENPGTLFLGGANAQLNVGPEGIANSGSIQFVGPGSIISADINQTGFMSKIGVGEVNITGDLTKAESAGIAISFNNTITVEGTFATEGAVAGDGTMAIGGEFQPGGDQIGSATFAGNLELRSGSTTQLQIGGLTTAQLDHFVVDGELVIQPGASLTVEFADGFTPQPGDAYFVSNPGTIVGTYDGLPQGASLGVIDGVELTISYSESDGSSIFLFASETTVPGDIDGDGEVSLADIAPFVELLVSGEFDEAGDLNGDGVVDLSDIPLFVELLSGG